MMKLPKENKVGLLVVIVAFLSLAQLLYVTYENRQTTQCQAQVNQAFLDTVKQRASINDGDRQAVKSLVEALANAKSPADTTKAIDAYDQRYQDLQDLRDSFAYPDVTGAC